jgi:hypothetical protein
LLALAQKDPGLLPAEGSAINMHCHSFFSFNAYGFSPTALVWLAKKLGLQVAGIVDFDNLDGVEEFLSGCNLACVRGSAAMETRIFIPEFADRVTNSPGEPGISYHMGIGFSSQNVNEKGKNILQGMRERAEQRNRNMVRLLNTYLDPVIVNYDTDVLPLTPAGNVTERHMLAAYIDSAKRTVKDQVRFWSEKLEKDSKTIHDLMQNAAAFANTVRRKLMKRGGVSYTQPSPKNFPTAEEFHEMVISNGALPALCYLNGTTEGEQCMEELLSLLVSKGVVAMNMIPNLAVPEPFSDPDNSELRQTRSKLLLNTANLAREFDLPLHIGTEMNSYGQRQVDDLNSPELAPLRDRFIDGAYFIYGHVRLHRSLGIGYQSEWANSFLPTRSDRNSFYTRAGFLIPPGIPGFQALKKLNVTMSPQEIVTKLES